ncbi:hypothetical protein GCK72_003161 [Caenorhabditis remanei]|uniref:Uncharacterized protein n=1 Tax=Caenorhabditis remanei TaxID=31234 RepID=A0A6A5HUP1_CAERE|nr:hypothetical protein GCK72_003161 [Caenorhabditis remanei]KAF1771335.1 hypothetical protein GCK72_003161 [Caenorhabditis remanei]
MMPAVKRAHTEPDLVEFGEYVPFQKYAELYQYVARLSKLVNELRVGIIESDPKKLRETIADTCECIPDLPPMEEPMIIDDVFPNATNTSSKPLSYASVAGKPPVDPYEIAKAASILLDKSSRVVVEKMLDNKDDPAQEKSDLLFFTEFAKANNLPQPSEAHRHPSKSNYRPLKLQFASRTDRDKFLHGYYKRRLSDDSLSKLPIIPRARRDLTKIELEKLYESRKFVYEENKKAGVSKYIMYDIGYKINAKPQPFS